MALNTTVLETDYKNVIADAPNTLVFSGQTVSVVKGERDESHELDEAGYQKEYDLEVMAVLSEFTTVPDIGEKITLDGTVYEVTNKKTSFDDQAVHFMLKEAT